MLRAKNTIKDLTVDTVTLKQNYCCKINKITSDGRACSLLINIELILKKLGHKHERPSRKKTKYKGKNGGGGIETLICCSQHYIRAQQQQQKNTIY